MLASLAAQPTQPLETIVVDQSTPRYDLEPFEGLVHLHDTSINGSSQARNRGIERATGDIIVFFDDDAVLESDCIAEVAACYAARPDVIGVQCAVTNPWDRDPFFWYRASTLIFEHGFFNQRDCRRKGLRVPRLIDGLASSYRRSLFERERFDEALVAYALAEDWDITKRAARHGALLVAEKARVRHECSPHNRLDTRNYLEMRVKNVLYLYEKLGAARDPRNRMWKAWWLLGESLRTFKLDLRERSHP